MKTKYYQPLSLLLIVIMFISFTSLIKAQSKNESPGILLAKRDSSGKSTLEYKKISKEVLKKQKGSSEASSNKLDGKSKIFGLSFDLIGGYSSSLTEYEKNVNSPTNIPATSNNVLFTAANIKLTLFGVSFTTGLSYSTKGFKTFNDNKIDMKYFNLPFLYTFSFNWREIVIEPSIGPSVGIMLTSKNNKLFIRNIDIGIIGSVQGTYMLNKHFGVLMGFKYEFGGLTHIKLYDNVPNINSKNWMMYSGLKIVVW